MRNHASRSGQASVSSSSIRAGDWLAPLAFSLGGRLVLTLLHVQTMVAQVLTVVIALGCYFLSRYLFRCADLFVTH